MDRELILATLRERILAFATLRVPRDRAEDLAQDVLVVLHDTCANVTELAELVPLAFQILRFKMLDVHRKSLRRGEYNQESVDDLPLADPGRPGRTARSEATGGSAPDRSDTIRRTLPRAIQVEAGREQLS